MENKISVPRLGMKKSVDPRNLSENDYTFAMNMNLSEVDNDFIDGSYEKSNILSVKFPDDYRVIGRVNRLKTNSTYYFLTNVLTGNSLFGVVDNKSYFDDSELEDSNLEDLTQVQYKSFKILLDDSCTNNKFNFSDLHPIQNIVFKEEKTGGVVYFTDFINPSRYIEVDNLDKYFTQEVPCSTDISLNCVDVSKMRIHKLYELPEITNITVSNGGSLSRGTYSFLVALSDALGNEISEYTSITQPVSIWDNTDDTTSKAIKLTLGSIDPSYTHVKVVVIYNQHADNTQTYRKVGVFSSNSKDITVTSINNLERVSPETLNFVNLRVTNSENLTSFNNTLAEYGLVFERELNLQPVVNLMGSYLKWQTHVAREDLYSYPDMAYKYTGYNRNEVVPFSIRFLKKGGSYTALFPLVGREATPKDLESVDNKDTKSLDEDNNCVNSIRNARWQFYNTATVEDPCGSPEDFVEVEDIYNWTCTDNDTARTGPGSFEIPIDYVFTNLEDYYEDNGCFSNFCLVFNQDLSNQVVCDDSPCNNNPRLTDTINFISEEVNVRVEPIYDGGTVFWDYLADDVANYNNAPHRSIQNSTIQYPGDFYRRDTTPYSNYVEDTLDKRNTNIPSYARQGMVLPFKDENSYINMTPGNLVPIYYRNVESRNHTTINNTTETVYYGNTKPVMSSVGFKSGKIEGENILRCFFTNKNDDPDPILDEYINYEDFRVHFHGMEANSINMDREAFFSIMASDIKNKIIKVSYDRSGAKTITNRNGVNTEVGKTVVIKICDAQGVLISEHRIPTIKSDTFEYVDELFVICEMGRIENPTTGGPDIYLSPRGEFYMYFEVLEPIGQRVIYDDIVIGTNVSYEDTCIVLEPIVKSCEASLYKKGSFSYWESGINYPDNPELFDSTTLKIDQSDIPSQYRNEFTNKFTTGLVNGVYKIKDSYNLTCKPIRHFKFPDNKVSPFMQTGSNSKFSDSYIYPLGVTIDENVINMFLDLALKNNLITQEERDDIHGYEIFRGNLSVNRSVTASGLVYDTRSYKEKGKDVQYLNYPYNSYNTDPLNPDSGNKNGFGNVGNTFGFHSPETDYFNLNGANELSVQGYQFGHSKGFFDEVDGHPKMVVLSPKAYNTASTLATIEVAAEAAIETAKSMAAVPGLWIVGGLGSTGTNAGGWAAQLILAGVVGVIMAAEGIIYNYARYRLQWQETFKNLGQPRNFAHYYFSEGNYNNFRTLQTEGESLRGLRINKKIKDGRYVVTDNSDKTKTEINNIDREYTTFLKVEDIAYPNEYLNYDKGSLTVPESEGIQNQGRSEQIEKNIASPYVQIINYSPTQHGQINDINWLYTGYRGDLTYPDGGCIPIFGGDTYITRHTLKRKIPLFLTTAMGQADMTPFDYKVYNNIGKNPRYYISYDATSDFNKAGKIFPEVVSDYQLSNLTTKGNYIVPPSKFFLYYYGVPSFLTETRINTNYREFGREPGDNFYPNVGDLGWWTQQKNVPIRTPNYFKYYQTYSNNINSFNNRTLGINFKQKIQTIVERSVNGVVFSLPDVNENGQNDPWLKFRPLDFFEFETKFGKLKELKGIENEAILARFEDTAIIYNKVTTTVDDGTNPAGRLGGRDIFQRRTTSFVNSELGYGGTQQAESLSCEFGHFYVDNSRGQILQIPPGGGNITEISLSNGKDQTFMKDWFKRNLPFKILKSKIKGIEELDVDNNYNGIGMTLGYDSLHKRLLITKKDYLPINDCISYSKDIGFYTTCGDNVQYSCLPGYNFNPLTLTCDREVESDLCPPGFTFDDASKMCVKKCGGRFAFLIDNSMSGISSMNFMIQYITDQINSTNTATISLYTTYGNSIVVEEDMTIAQTLAYLPSLLNLTAETVDNVFETMCVAKNWLNLDTSVTRIMNGLYYLVDPQNSTNKNCDGSIGFSSLGSSIIGSGIINLGVGDGVGLRNEGVFSPNGFVTSLNGVPPEFIPYYASATCDGDEIKEPDCNCEIQNEKCVCIESVPPIITNTTRVELYDEEMFKDISWTVAYNLSDGSFNSFMSYTPNYYVNMQGYYESGLNEENTTLWSHSITNKSYGVFYGLKNPMEIELIVKGSMNGYIGAVSLFTEAKKYYNEEDYWINPDLTFNKSIIYNRRECSGNLKLDLVKGRVSQYPITEVDGQRIPITKTESLFNYNYFFDRVDHKNNVPFIINDENQINITLGNINFKQKSPLPRLNGDYFLNRLTYDIDSRYNMTLKLHKTLTNLDNL